MRPNTIESGILSTKRNRPVSTSMLTRMLVPKPKNAFQSVIVQTFGRKILVSVMLIARSCRMPARFESFHHALASRADVPSPDREVRANKRETSAPTRGLLEAEADAAEADDVVLVRLSIRNAEG